MDKSKEVAVKQEKRWISFHDSLCVAQKTPQTVLCIITPASPQKEGVKKNGSKDSKMEDFILIDFSKCLKFMIVQFEW